MESPVKLRLIEYLTYKKIGQNKFALSCGLSSGFISNIDKSIKQSTLLTIATYYPDLNTTWILTGEGQMLRNTTDSNQMLNEPVSQYELIDKDELIRELRDRVKFQANIITELLTKIK